jgi:hypothetical protein
MMAVVIIMVFHPHRHRSRPLDAVLLIIMITHLLVGWSATLWAWPTAAPCSRRELPSNAPVSHPITIILSHA